MKKQTPTPYDDAFRTMLNDCPRLIIPLVNEVFDKNYSPGDTVYLFQNEFYILSSDDKKIISDSNFSIGLDTDKYLFECQSTYDGTISIRIFEYSSQVAIRDSVTSINETIFTLPKAALLDLRGRYSSDTMKITIRTPDGSVSYNVPVVKVPDYDLEEIFEKKLFFLIPFYFFRYNLKELEKSKKSLEKMKETYDTIFNKLDVCIACGELTSYDKICIIRMCQQVAAALAANYEKTSKGVKEIMGGKILDYDGKDILRQGISQGMKQGMEQGMKQGMKQGISQGICEGERTARISDIIALLTELGTVPENIRTQILSENNIDKLKTWLKLAARTDSIESFEAQM